MQTVEQYAASVVEKYRGDTETGSAAYQAAEEITPLLRQWSGKYLQGITLSGAYAQNTAVRLSSDVDVLVELCPVAGKGMREIFWSLFDCLSQRGLRPHAGNVTIGVEVRGRHVELIPACREGKCDILFNKRAEGEVRTEVAKHVHLLANSGRQQEICALKIWRERHELDFPSLYLALTALKALEAERFGQLADNVWTALRYMAHRFEKLAVVDPANEENVVSDDLSSEGKAAIARAAREALYENEWSKLIW